MPGLGYGRTTTADSAVVLFFVLSGFLITLLLLREKQACNQIRLRLFYQRRLLRILPVYAMSVTWGLALSKLGLCWVRGPEFLYYLGGVPNVAYAFGLDVFCLKPLWSVGVEEQFYLCWPWLVSRTKRLPRAILGVCLGYLIIKISLRFLENGHWYELARLTSVDSLGIGAYAAWLFHTDSRLMKPLLSPACQVFCWGFVAYGILFEPLQITSLLSAETQAPVFACIILNMAANPKPLIKGNRGPLKNLGSISYGLYAYHMPIMCSIGPAIKRFTGSMESSTVFLIGTFTTLALSILTATLSWHLLEKPLLKLKPYPTTLKSSPESAQEA